MQTYERSMRFSHSIQTLFLMTALASASAAPGGKVDFNR